MKTSKKLKARRMWAVYYPELVCCHYSRNRARERSEFASDHPATPVAVIPLDDVDSLLRAAGDAFSDSYDGHLVQADIVAMLEGIGVLPRARKGRK